MPTDKEAQSFQQWHSAGAPPSGQPRASGGGWTGTAKDILGSTSATISGLGKGLAQMGAPPGGVSLNEADPQGPVATWAKSEDKQYPVAEKAGRWTAEYGPLALLPDIGAPGAFAKAVPELPRIARVVGKGAEGLWKGAVGGRTQGDPKTGAEVGGGTATAAAALKEFPQLMWPAGFMAYEAARGGGVKLPWGAWHLSYPLAALAAAAMGFAPGISGAAGAKAFGEGKRGDQP
jgi:hypothetical protein